MKKHKKKSYRTRLAVNSTAAQKKYKQPQEIIQKKNSFTKVFLIIFMFLIGIVFVIVSGSFDITEIIVEENHSISSEQIISFSNIQKGTNIFSISKKNIVNRLKENSYINDVKVKKIFPNKIKLIVDERKLEYVLQLANSYVYMNRQGYVLEISNEYPNVPIIVGFTTDLSNIKRNDRLVESDLKKMNTIIKIMEMANHTEIASLVTKIDVSNEMNYAIYFDTEGKIAYLGDATQLNIRFLYIKKLIEIYQGKAGEILVDGDLNSEDVYFREVV